MPLDLAARIASVWPDLTQPSLPRRPYRRRSNAFLAAAFILPLVILAAGTWGAWRSAERELSSDADALAEYAQRVIDSHRVVGEFTNDLLRGLSDADIRAREAELHRDLRDRRPSLPGVVTIAVVDRDAEVILMGNARR